MFRCLHKTSALLRRTRSDWRRDNERGRAAPGRSPQHRPQRRFDVARVNVGLGHRRGAHARQLGRQRRARQGGAADDGRRLRRRATAHQRRRRRRGQAECGRRRHGDRLRDWPRRVGLPPRLRDESTCHARQRDRPNRRLAAQTHRRRRCGCGCRRDGCRRDGCRCDGCRRGPAGRPAGRRGHWHRAGGVRRLPLQAEHVHRRDVGNDAALTDTDCSASSAQSRGRRARARRAGALTRPWRSSARRTFPSCSPARRTRAR